MYPTSPKYAYREAQRDNQFAARAKAAMFVCFFVCVLQITFQVHAAAKRLEACMQTKTYSECAAVAK